MDPSLLVFDSEKLANLSANILALEIKKVNLYIESYSFLLRSDKPLSTEKQKHMDSCMARIEEQFQELKSLIAEEQAFLQAIKDAPAQLPPYHYAIHDQFILDTEYRVALVVSLDELLVSVATVLGKFEMILSFYDLNEEEVLFRNRMITIQTQVEALRIETLGAIQGSLKKRRKL